MKIVEVRFDATFNKGNYESEKIGFTAQVEEGENALDVLERLRSLSKGEMTSASPEKPTKQETVPALEKEPEQVAEEKPKKSKKKKEVAPAEEKSEESENSKKKSKSSATPYQRTVDLHKKLLGQFLDSEKPGWRTNVPLKQKCVEISKELEGTDFLDSEGLILEEFKVSFLEKF